MLGVLMFVLAISLAGAPPAATAAEPSGSAEPAFECPFC
jgi:hypothetical protein